MFAADSNLSPLASADPLTAESAPSWKQIIEHVEPFLTAVNQRLAQQVSTFHNFVQPYAEYALTGEGKHLRPALVALSGSATGKVSDAHVTVAVIIEMVHLATLVHDDIMDESEIRRGRLTLASNYGNEVSVLFGDCLFAQALRLAASFPTPEVCRSVASATHTVCSGEILQTQHRRDFKLPLEKYFKVLEMKTAELFALSCELSAFLNNCSQDQRSALRRYGIAFGVAYQIYDDCLDLFGTEEMAGKSLGTDLLKGKLTLPLLLLREACDAAELRRLKDLVMDWQPEHMKLLTELLSKYDMLSASQGVMNSYLDQARQALESLPRSTGTSALTSLTDFLSRQTALLATCV